jgi:hypothetical protein
LGERGRKKIGVVAGCSSCSSCYSDFKQASKMAEEDDNGNVRLMAEFTVLFGNLQKARAGKNIEEIKKAKAILDEHGKKMTEAINTTRKEIAGKPRRSFTKEQVDTAYGETMHDLDKEISKLKGNSATNSTTNSTNATTNTTNATE